MNILSVKDLPLTGKKVLLRVDFNVPFTAEGKISDSTRIQEALPTISYILQQGASIILLSHCGRPKGKVDMRYTLQPCVEVLSSFLHRAIFFSTNCIGEDAKNQTAHLQPGEILLLENLRFHAAEENPSLDAEFAKTLASFADIYINDAFGAAHRKHASTYDIVSYFPHKAGIGFLMEKEIAFLQQIVHHPKKPLHILIGGAKISSKMGVLSSLIPKTDALYIGGAMAFTFFAAQQIPIGASLYEKDHIATAIHIQETCQQYNTKLFLPIDLIVAKQESHQTINTEDGILPGWQGLDIGPATLQAWTQNLRAAKTIFWNGPMGLFEDSRFAKGTSQLAQFLADLSVTTIVGGGDSVAAIHQLHVQDRFTHISTGGGASLEFLEHGSLPALDVLSSTKNPL